MKEEYKKIIEENAEIIEERAAILEYDCGEERSRAEAKAKYEAVIRAVQVPDKRMLWNELLGNIK